MTDQKILVHIHMCEIIENPGPALYNTLHHKLDKERCVIMHVPQHAPKFHFRCSYYLP